MNVRGFYRQQSEPSRIKAEIVSAYFHSWATVLAQGSQQLSFVDLFAGRGEYDDGTKSTPLLVLEGTVAKPAQSEKVGFWFNDKDASFISNLEAIAEKLPGFDRLVKRPEFTTSQVDQTLVDKLERRTNIPTLLFIDPWGYKALSLDLINSVLKHPKSEVIFFFNYRRINAAITNRVFERHILNLFGEATARQLQKQIETENLSPHERETAVVDAVRIALQNKYANYVRPFRFLNQAGNRCTHHIIFATKHPLGLSIMKEIMAKHSTGCIDDVPTYEYNPATIRQPSLGLADPLEDLAQDLLLRFRGQTQTVKDIFQSHHVHTDFVRKNYRDALLRLEHRGKITAESPGKQTRRKGTMGDNIRVTFRI